MWQLVQVGRDDEDDIMVASRDVVVGFGDLSCVVRLVHKAHILN